MFEKFDCNHFWEDSEYAKEEYVEEIPTNELITQVEKELGFDTPHI